MAANERHLDRALEASDRLNHMSDDMLASVC
jgi:hypothetical protein